MELHRKKQLGAYYTPDVVTDSLCAWAIRSRNDILLEPSFGGCNFLVSSMRCLNDLGNRSPYKEIYGCDIDECAFTILGEKKIPQDNFHKKDFLLTSNKDFPKKAIAIIGNPPYLPIHKLPAEYKKEVLAGVRFDGISIGYKSSLWVYFIVHSLSFLEAGGRMAWVVPDSISFSNYGKSFLSELSCLFKTIKLLRIKERFFSESGTLEKTSILLCDGFKTGSSEASIHNFERLKDALEGVKTGIYPQVVQQQLQVSEFNPGFEKVRLGDVFDIKIGIVLGATRLLAFKKEEVVNTPFYPNHVYPIVTKGGQLQNLSIDIESLLNANQGPVYLLNGIKLEDNEPEIYRELLNSIPESVIENQTFKKRTHPFGYDDFRHPDAFLTYFTQKHPRLILNVGRQLNCTNSVHRLYFKEKYRDRIDLAKFIAIQTFVNFNCEEVLSVAREYGNGIIKYEPSNAADIPVLLPITNDGSFIAELEDVFERMTDLLITGSLDKAKYIGTSFISHRFSLLATA